MSKINNLVAGIATLAAVTATNAQQALKNITDNTNATVVKIIQPRNNSTAQPNSTVWSNGFDAWSSGSSGTVFFRTVAGQNMYAATTNNLTAPTIPNESIGNGTFTTISNTKKELINYENTAWTQTFNITTTIENTDRDALEDTNNNIDLFTTTISLPKMLNDWSMIQDNTWAVVRWRNGNDLNNWSTVSPAPSIVLQRNQSQNKRILPATARDGGTNPGLSIPDIDTNGQVLGIEDFEWNKKDNSKIFPNPIEDQFSFDDGDNNSNEKIKYKFIDLNGRVIESGILSENQPTSLSQDHKPGVEMLVLEDEDGNQFSKKAILK